MPRFERVNPILCVRDVPASIAYYTEHLGFLPEFQWGDPISFGGVTRDDVDALFEESPSGEPTCGSRP